MKVDRHRGFNTGNDVFPSEPRGRLPHPPTKVNGNYPWKRIHLMLIMDEVDTRDIEVIPNRHRKEII